MGNEAAVNWLSGAADGIATFRVLFPAGMAVPTAIRARWWSRNRRSACCWMGPCRWGSGGRGEYRAAGQRGACAPHFISR
ncbi:hypothetical protein ACVXG8_01165 [Escherichia coli]